MHVSASKYIAAETVSSFIANAILNFVGAYLLFHARPIVPTGGEKGLCADLIGEAFIATFLSVLVPTLIARSRRRSGTLPADERATRKPGNPYLFSLLVGLAFTAIAVPCEYLLLPRIYPSGATFHDVLLVKTVYGTLLGGIATYIALRRALIETE